MLFQLLMIISYFWVRSEIARSYVLGIYYYSIKVCWFDFAFLCLCSMDAIKFRQQSRCYYCSLDRIKLRRCPGDVAASYNKRSSRMNVLNEVIPFGRSRMFEVG